MADWTRPFDAAYVWRRVPRSTYSHAYHPGAESGVVGNITGGTITANADTETFETATVDCVGPLDVGTDLVRAHLVATFADGSSEDVVLGTFLASAPSRKVRGSYESCVARLDGRLIELAEDSFESPVVLDNSVHARSYAEVVTTGGGLTVNPDLPASDKYLGARWAFGLSQDGDAPGGSKLDCVNELLSAAGLRAAQTDPYGRLWMRPAIDYYAPPTWTFREGAGATFLSEAEDERDATKVANVVLAIFESAVSTVVGVAEDTDPASPWGVPSIGRRRVAKYSYNDGATQAQADARAAQLLATQQSVVRRVKIRHVWCGARVGDVVRVEWPSAGISGSFAIRTQSIEVGSPGCLCTSELRAFERR